MDDVHDIRDDNCHPGLLHVPAVTEAPAHEAQGEACAVAVEQPSPAAVDGVHERPLPDEADEPDAKRTLTGRDIFLRGGPKKELGAGQLFSGEEDLPLLQSRMDALQSAWQLKHEASSRHVSYGLWPPGSSVVEVLLRRGRGWNTFGQSQASRWLMIPEEALFLMESDRMLVYRAVGDEAPMTLHAGYAAAAETGLTAERYAVFAHLCRLGFAVRRNKSVAPRFEQYVSIAPAAPQVPPLAAEDLPGVTPAATEDEPRVEGDAADAADEEGGQPGADEPGADADATIQDACMQADHAVSTSSRGWWRVGDAWPQAKANGLVLVDALPHEAQASADAWHPELLYDVWNARFNLKFAKPIFRVVMSTHRPPNAAEMAKLCRQNGSISLKCIVVKPGIVIGFDFGVVTSTSLPRQRGN